MWNAGFLRRAIGCVALALCLVLAGCGRGEPAGAAGSRAGRVRAFVSIQPQAFALERVGGPHVDVQVLVEPGQEPHAFEPTPRQMAALAESSVYFLGGVPFEHALAERLREAGEGLRLVDAVEGIEPRAMKSRGHPEHEDAGAGGHAHTAPADPHTWLDPNLLAVQARHMAAALGELDPDHADAYARNLAALEADLAALDARIRGICAGLEQRRFIVFHPAFGYFADAYGLEQIPIEVEGKEPGPRELAELVDRARALDVRVIFAEQQFSQSSARAVAEAIDGRVVLLDPLARDYVANLERIAEAFAASMR